MDAPPLLPPPSKQRTLPADLKSSILALSNLPASTPNSVPSLEGAPQTPSTPDYGDDLESMFFQRPADVELLNSTAKDYQSKVGVDESKAYGYALDAYLEGVSEFWGCVESIREEEEGEVEEEEEEGTPMSEAAAVERRQSLAGGLAEGLRNVIEGVNDRAAATLGRSEVEEGRQKEIANW